MTAMISHPELIRFHEELKTHPLYSKIRNAQDLRVFMETHVFAVWDFMSLLKRLQKDLTCVSLPWKPSPYPKAVVRLINEIVLGEESDIGPDGKPVDHFTLYMKAMNEMQADPQRLNNLMLDLNFDKWCSKAEKEFVQFNLNLAENGKIHEVAAAFFFGREKLIPDMFTSILKDLENNLEHNTQTSFPALRFYLERHIEIDGGEHSHHAHECLIALCENDEMKWYEAIAAGIQSLKLRSALWSEVEKRITV